MMAALEGWADWAAAREVVARSQRPWALVVAVAVDWARAGRVVAVVRVWAVGLARAAGSASRRGCKNRRSVCGWSRVRCR